MEAIGKNQVKSVSTGIITLEKDEEVEGGEVFKALH